MATSMPALSIDLPALCDRVGQCRTALRKPLVVLASALLCGLFAVPDRVSAQELAIDFLAPSIQHDVADEAAVTQPGRFVATVEDNVAVASVTLNYRLDSEAEFVPLAMEADATREDLFAAKPPLEPDFEGTVEYFIEASDDSGTTSTRGSRFSPLQRRISADVPIAGARRGGMPDRPDPANPGAAGTEPAAEPMAEPRRSRTWWYVLGGALAAGVVAALVSSSSSDDEAVACCQVRFVVEPFAQ